METIDWAALRVTMILGFFAIVMFGQAVAGFVFLQKARTTCTEVNLLRLRWLTISAFVSLCLVFGTCIWRALTSEDRPEVDPVVAPTSYRSAMSYPSQHYGVRT